MVAAYSSSSCLHPRSSPDFSVTCIYYVCMYVHSCTHTLVKVHIQGQRATLWHWLCSPTMWVHLPGGLAWLRTDHISNPPFLFLKSFILWLLDRGWSGGYMCHGVHLLIRGRLWFSPFTVASRYWTEIVKLEANSFICRAISLAQTCLLTILGSRCQKYLLLW